MSRSLALALVLAILAALAGGAPAEAPLPIVPGVAIGPMVLGAPGSRTATAWGPARLRKARQGAHYRWHEYPERSAWMLVRDGIVVRAGVESSGYATREGFQVGTRVESIVTRWGRTKPRRAIPWTEHPGLREEDQFEPSVPPERYFLDYSSRGISFLVDATLGQVVSIQIYPPRRPGSTR
ncbi:MAG TPA: hypothetical protein VNO81_04355 [Candidatus Nitrosotenuis sp.]|nr:hypothetical protein [Candidatus Nitrosotenuis sp.]